MFNWIFIILSIHFSVWFLCLSFISTIQNKKHIWKLSLCTTNIHIFHCVCLNYFAQHLMLSKEDSTSVSSEWIETAIQKAFHVGNSRQCLKARSTRAHSVKHGNIRFSFRFHYHFHSCFFLLCRPLCVHTAAVPFTCILLYLVSNNLFIVQANKYSEVYPFVFIHLIVTECPGVT